MTRTRHLSVALCLFGTLVACNGGEPPTQSSEVDAGLTSDAVAPMVGDADTWVSVSSSGASAVAPNLFGTGQPSWHKDATSADFRARASAIGFHSYAFPAGAISAWHHYGDCCGYNQDVLEMQMNGAGAMPVGNAMEDNASGVSYWELFLDIAEDRRAVDPLFRVAFAANPFTGTVEELALFLADLTERGLPFDVTCGLEMSYRAVPDPMTGVVDLSEEQYATNVAAIAAFVHEHYPDADVVASVAPESGHTDHVGAEWNDRVAALDIEAVSQYQWIDFGAAGHNAPPLEGTADEIFTDLAASFDGWFAVTMDEELDALREAFPGKQIHLGQAGTNAQRTATIDNTMLEAMALWRYFFHAVRYNAAHNGFIANINYQRLEEMVSEYDARYDSTFSSGPNVTRAVGEAATRIAPIFASSSEYLPSDVSGAAAGAIDVFVSRASDTVSVFLVNPSAQAYSIAVLVDGVALGGTHHVSVMSGANLYASLGRNPLVATHHGTVTDIALGETEQTGTNVSVPPYSMVRVSY